MALTSAPTSETARPTPPPACSLPACQKKLRSLRRRSERPATRSKVCALFEHRRRFDESPAGADRYRNVFACYLSCCENVCTFQGQLSWQFPQPVRKVISYQRKNRWQDGASHVQNAAGWFNFPNRLVSHQPRWHRIPEMVCPATVRRTSRHRSGTRIPFLTWGRQMDFRSQAG
jgi:hypothetical protein